VTEKIIILKFKTLEWMIAILDRSTHDASME